MLYTFVVEFRGGTYIHQIDARAVRSALRTWMNELVERRIVLPHLGPVAVKRLRERFGMGEVHEVPILGVANVWFVHFPSKQGSLFGNVVRTAP